MGSDDAGRDEAPKLRRRAFMHMRIALALLDELNEDVAACHQQLACEIVADNLSRMAERGSSQRDEHASDPSGLVTDAALLRAIGGTLAIYATMLSRAGIASVDEIADGLEAYAEATSPTSSQEGFIISCWSALLRGIGDKRREAF